MQPGPRRGELVYGQVPAHVSWLTQPQPPAGPLAQAVVPRGTGGRRPYLVAVSGLHGDVHLLVIDGGDNLVATLNTWSQLRNAERGRIKAMKAAGHRITPKQQEAEVAPAATDAKRKRHGMPQISALRGPGQARRQREMVRREC